MKHHWANLNAAGKMNSFGCTPQRVFQMMYTTLQSWSLQKQLLQCETISRHYLPLLLPGATLIRVIIPPTMETLQVAKKLTLADIELPKVCGVVLQLIWYTQTRRTHAH